MLEKPLPEKFTTQDTITGRRPRYVKTCYGKEVIGQDFSVIIERVKYLLELGYDIIEINGVKGR
jgi:hypothetical protein